ncbi:MAG: hypothetical protein JKX68_00445 [Flavobacteriales bacterium]|nr:hypothetical protein [Flavobacteriales bacterium]
MKKKVLFVAALFIGASAFAQDGLTSKKGEAFLPEAGDWALGFDGTPFLDYVGNMFNGTAGNSVNATWVGNNPSMTIVAKHFKDESTAYRMKLRIGFGSTNTKNIHDTSNTTLTGEITDEMSTSNFMLTLGGGIEKRRGNTRIQGFYGGEVLISFGSSSSSFTYADAGSGSSTATTPNLHTAIYTDDFVAGTTTSGGERDVDISNGSTMQIALRGFAGVEWFLSPKVSVAAEYGWGLAMSSQGDGERDTEEYTIGTGGSTETLISREHTTGGNSSFGIDTDNNGGQITIMFHF